MVFRLNLNNKGLVMLFIDNLYPMSHNGDSRVVPYYYRTINISTIGYRC